MGSQLSQLMGDRMQTILKMIYKLKAELEDEKQSQMEIKSKQQRAIFQSEKRTAQIDLELESLNKAISLLTKGD